MKCPADGATPVRQISWLSQIYAPTSSADDYLVGAPSRASSHNSQGPFWDIQKIAASLSDGGLVPLGSNDGCPNLLSTVSYGTGAFAKDAVVRYKTFHPIDVPLGGGRLRLHRFACQPVGVRCPTCSS